MGAEQCLARLIVVMPVEAEVSEMKLNIFRIDEIPRWLHIA